MRYEYGYVEIHRTRQNFIIYKLFGRGGDKELGSSEVLTV